MRRKSRLEGFRIVAVGRHGRIDVVAEKNGRIANAALQFDFPRSPTLSELRDMERVAVNLWFAIENLEDAAKRRARGRA